MVIFQSILECRSDE